MSCNQQDKDETLYRLLTDTGIDFSNDLNYTEELNPYTYRNFYNGGGVALGDINNDGLLDVFFTGNLVDNKLYLNQGDWKFRDITDNAGVGSEGSWSTGATFVDINADGYLDLYVCKAGPPGGPNRHNQLFINQGDLTFVDQSEEYGLDIVGLSIHSTFFDYDKDGDLDCYLLNNSIRSIGNFDLIKDQRNTPDKEGNKFFENVEGKFIDVTQEVGVYSSKIGFGLGVTLSDFNDDGWTDIFVSNDFFERDYLYLNDQGNGFVEQGDKLFQSFSMGSMGADAADIDNDLHTDLFVTEMLPATLERKKTKAVYESWDKYQSAVKAGYHHQFPRSVLQRNMGANGFLEVGRISGVDATEWSWASLIFDVDNDGLKDLFVSNGIYKDLLDRDYLAYMADSEMVSSMMSNNGEVLKKLIDIMPSEAIANVAFKNQGGFHFEKKASEWGLDQPNFSNGSAFGDLDNDGDMDLIVSNVNDKAFIYENTLDTSTNRFVSFKLRGLESNTNAIGSKATIYYEDSHQTVENYTSRGYQSSSSGILHFGIGREQKIDSLRIDWNNGTITRLYDLNSNKRYDLPQPRTQDAMLNSVAYHPLPILKEVHTFSSDTLIRVFNEFNKERLLFRMNSSHSPIVRVADANGDTIDDLFIGGGFNQESYLYLSTPSGDFESNSANFITWKRSIVSDAEFFDFDHDGDLDLYLAFGGRASSPYSADYNDVILENDSRGNYSLTKGIVFQQATSSGAVTIDSDNTLFVGERFNINAYGHSSSGYLFDQNNASVLSPSIEKVFSNMGMVTDAQWVDLDEDGSSELIVVGEWMPIMIYKKQENTFVEVSAQYNLKNTAGLWNKLKVEDLDQDGDMDLIVGNIGENATFQPHDRMYVNDFDQNGSIEQIICHRINNQYYPIHDYDDLLSQLAMLKRKFFKYEDYAKADMNQLFGEDMINSTTSFDLDITRTQLFINEGGKFKSLELPREVQYSSTYAIEVMDVNQDGIKDILLGGNHYYVKPQYGRDDASKGWLILGGASAEGNYRYDEIKVLGIEGQIRDIVKFNTKEIIISTTNNGVKSYKYNNEIQ